MNIQVIMATNRIETLDPALIRPGRIDRKIEFPLPDEKTKRRIFNIHTGGSRGLKGVVNDIIQQFKTESTFNEFEPRLKSPKNRFQLRAGLNLKKLNINKAEPTIFKPWFKFF